jgi:hypothetical protein
MIRIRSFWFFAISFGVAIAILWGCQPSQSINSLVGSSQEISQKAIADVSKDKSLSVDLGFRPETNGFSFENYGNENGIQNLTPASMQHMFGKQVCATEGESCILTPPAKRWMEETNKGMNGGHCEGMAALSLLLYIDKAKVDEFGKAPDLTLQGNSKLQHEIAYWFATQGVAPTAASEIRDRTPVEILNLLTDGLKSTNSPTYTMGIYQQGFKGGHAITPYAIEELDSGKVAVLVYDNNHPKLERRLEIDRNANTWKYNASTKPDEAESMYIGDAESKTLTLTPTPPRLQQQQCDFCGNTESASNSSEEVIAKSKAIATGKFNQIFLEGDSDLLITNGSSKIGYENGKFINAFPGAFFIPMKSSDLWEDDEEPLYNIPLGVPFTMTLQSSRETKGREPTDVVMIGPGYDVGLSGIKVLVGQKDSIQFGANGRSLSYKPSNPEAPNILFGIATDKDDYEFEIDDVEIDAGGTLSANLDTAKGRLGIKIADTKQEASFNLILSRIDSQQEQTFEGEGLTLNSGDTLYLDYAKWTGNGGKLILELDKGSDGTIDEVTTLNDKKNNKK